MLSDRLEKLLLALEEFAENWILNIFIAKKKKDYIKCCDVSLLYSLILFKVKCVVVCIDITWLYCYC